MVSPEGPSGGVSSGPLPSGPHGGDGAVVARALGLDPDSVLDLSQSLNPAAPDPSPVVARHMTALHRYPDCEPAKEALARSIGVGPERVLLTNGGAEAIALVAAELGGSVVEPDFSLYPRHGGPRWRSNPHNPTGLLAPEEEQAGVWDEAFFPLAAGRWTRGDAGAVVVGSLTKLLACPGLRVGYVLASPERTEFIERCRRRQPAWAVNGLATSALPDLLATVDLKGWCSQVAGLRKELTDVLARHGLHAMESDACWVLVDAPDLRSRLAPLGIVVRDCATFGLRGVARIAVPDAHGLDRFENALASLASRTRARDGQAPQPHTDSPGEKGQLMTSPGLAHLLEQIHPVDGESGRMGAELHDRLTKPRGALGRLEDIGIQLCAIAGTCPPPVPEPVTVAVFAGDHGVVAEGVTPWPQEVTAQMVTNFCAGGAAINVLARHAGADVVVVDVGVASAVDEEIAGLRRRKVRAGTGNIAVEPAMTPAEAAAAVEVGADVAHEALALGAGLLVTGDMGIGNTTASACVIAALTGRSAAEVTGRGTGIDDAMLEHKVDVVTAALRRLGADRAPMVVLSEVGGLEIAALTGFILAGAAARRPVVIDGVIAGAAALLAAALAPDAIGYLVAGHRSTEPGASAALVHLGLSPVLDLGLRLGEGSGAVLAVPGIQAAAKILREMSTFDAAGVTDKVDDGR